MEEGTILKPNKPLTLLDKAITLAFDTLENIQLLDTFTLLEGHMWHYLLAANISSPISLEVSDFDLNETKSYFVWNFHTQEVVTYDSTHPLSIPSMTIPPYNFLNNCMFPPCAQSIDFRYWMITTSFENGWTLLGETNKFVTVANARIINIITDETGIQIFFSGSKDEVVEWGFLTPSMQQISVICTISNHEANVTCTNNGATPICNCATNIVATTTTGSSGTGSSGSTSTGSSGSSSSGRTSFTSTGSSVPTSSSGSSGSNESTTGTSTGTSNIATGGSTSTGSTESVQATGKGGSTTAMSNTTSLQIGNWIIAIVLFVALC